MDFEQYRDRNTTPLAWHKFCIWSGLIVGIISGLAAVVLLIGSNSLIEVIEQEIAQTGVAIPLPAQYIIIVAVVSCFISLGMGILMFWLGRNFKMGYIILEGIALGLSAIGSISSIFDTPDVPTIISEIISIGIIALQVIYYYKRLPLFSSDYVDPNLEDPNEGQINYDQINQ